MRVIVPLNVSGSYSYAGTGYANPHALTQIANGISTTTHVPSPNGYLYDTPSGDLEVGQYALQPSGTYI
ncbi:MAG: hypothetical protein WBL39_12895, partial [Terrimicrobiaceae bacterium]